MLLIILPRNAVEQREVLEITVRKVCYDVFDESRLFPEKYHIRVLHGQSDLSGPCFS